MGQSLEAYFQQRGDQVTILTRHPQANNHRYWNGQGLGEWTAEIEKADVVINLTGKSVDCRYTGANRAEILRSRVASTQVLGQAIVIADSPPALWFNASSATIYVHADHQRMTEATGIIGDDFSMSVCKAWEETFFEFDLPETRQVALRTSIALGNGGGAFPKMKTITRLGLGGRQGSGKQWMSWIHITDFCRAVAHIIRHEEIKGPINVTAPCPMRNRNFMRHLRSALGVPIGIPQPVTLLEVGAWLLGTETELLLKSRNVYPECLLESGFKFQFTNAEEAIRDLV